MSRYQTFRRWIAPIAFGVAIALLARDSCGKQARTHATVVFDLGAAADTARAFDADLTMIGAGGGEETIAKFHKAALANDVLGPVKLEVSLPSEDVDAKLDVDLGTRHVRVTRHLHVLEGSTVTIPLADALAAGP